MDFWERRLRILILSFDTSNYTTSVAVIDRNYNILYDNRKLLNVKKGNRGLRQSDALFQHTENLTEMFSEDFPFKDAIEAVAVSSRPRNIEGSYMPCFKAGMMAGRIASKVLDVPYLEFSHQEGHIAAASLNTELFNESHFIGFHLSGGTCEILNICNGSTEIVGGSLDISFGQLIDRAGVFYGESFPSGKVMDKYASQGKHTINFKKTKIENGFFNLSGIENQIIKSGVSVQDASRSLFDEIACIINEAVKESCLRFNINKVLLMGGVASSSYIRKCLGDNIGNNRIFFGSPSLSSDNAVGTAILGGKKIWQQNL